MTQVPRRQFLSILAASAGLIGTAGCVGTGFPGGGGAPDRSVYLGAYHWGFVLLDEDGTEHEQLVLDPDTSVRLVGFNTSAGDAISQLPQAVEDAVPDHEELEERNEARIPSPPSGSMHDALEEANEQYPNHSLAVMPSGWNHMRGPMGGGMMLHPIPLPRFATQPTVTGIRASQRGDYTVSCLEYCGYGHPYMELEEAFVVP
ncbi:cupredoxin domain-containing protein [Haloarcula brevis]|uniref:hypothetical protein n=1 Tax=Haloarcula brevis TaxID=3111453 RepID=UPI00300F09D1